MRAWIGSLVLALALVGCGQPPSSTRDIPGAPAQNRTAQPLRTVSRMVVPPFTVDKDGRQGDPVNLLIVATEQQMVAAFKMSGWLGADPITPRNAAKMVKAAIFRTPYPTSPMSDLFLFGRRQDYSFQKNSANVHKRDHLRVWRSRYVDRYGRPMWCIAATRDVAIKFLPDDGLMPTHQISPDIDAERQLVVDDFLRTRMVALRYQIDSLGPNFRGINGTGDEYFTDGQVEVLELLLVS